MEVKVPPLYSASASDLDQTAGPARILPFSPIPETALIQVYNGYIHSIT
jgi:hypothetical protein